MPAGNLSWRDAAEQVLRAANEAMHYTDIADAIVRDGLRTQIGATPATSVNVAIRLSMRNEGEHSPFTQTGRGEYIVKPAGVVQVDLGKIQSEPEVIDLDDVDEQPAGIISAFGMYWRRDQVKWSARPKLLGAQQQGAEPVDFCDQIGVYMLHDYREIVYVGRTTDQPLGKRLYQHTFDRLNGRWDRFSWFGLHDVSEEGKLELRDDLGRVGIDTAITTLEAVLIEGLEPRQNRKRGDDFRAAEYLQVLDPQIERDRVDQALDSLRQRAR